MVPHATRVWRLDVNPTHAIVRAQLCIAQVVHGAADELRVRVSLLGVYPLCVLLGPCAGLSLGLEEFALLLSMCLNRYDSCMRFLWVLQKEPIVSFYPICR